MENKTGIETKTKGDDKVVLKKGDKVKIRDLSWSYFFADNGIEPISFMHHGEVRSQVFEVIRTGLKMPIDREITNLGYHTDSLTNIPDNDVLVKNPDGRIISTQERFLVPVVPKINPNNMTEEDAIKYHREMWGWLADNSNKTKYDWPGWGKFDGGIIAHCFLCHYSTRITGGTNDYMCDKCPAIFAPNSNIKGSTGYCLGGLFDMWSETPFGSPNRSKLAKMICDIPMKIEWKEKLK